MKPIPPLELLELLALLELPTPLDPLELLQLERHPLEPLQLEPLDQLDQLEVNQELRLPPQFQPPLESRVQLEIQPLEIPASLEVEAKRPLVWLELLQLPPIQTAAVSECLLVLSVVCSLLLCCNFVTIISVNE